MSSLRISFLDFFKYIFALGVVYMHSFHSPSTFIIIDGFIKLSVPFFFICSGYFVNFNNSFYQRLKSYIYLYLFWMLLYSYQFVDNLGFIHKEGSFFLKLLKVLYIAFFVEGYFHLWYLIALIYGLIIIYMLRRFFSPMVICIIALFFYCWGLLGDSYSFLDEYHFFYPIHLIWGNTRNCLTYAFPFLCLGLFIRDCKIVKIKYISVLLVLSLFLYFAEVYFVRGLARQSFLFVFTPVVLYFLFLFIINLNVNIKNRLVLKFIRTSDLCYFIHPLIIPIAFFINESFFPRFLLLYLGVILISYLFYSTYKLIYNYYCLIMDNIYNSIIKIKS